MKKALLTLLVLTALSASACSPTDTKPQKCESCDLSTHRCVAGRCVAKQANGCGTGCDLTTHDCNNGVCTPKQKTCDASCDLTTHDCNDGVCTPKQQTCDASCDLTTHDCNNGVCTPKPMPPGCEPPCDPDTEVCTGHVCAEKSTCVNFTCPNPTETCQFGKCVYDGYIPNFPDEEEHKCQNVTCPDFQECENGTCKSPCSGNTYCDHRNQVCSAGTCVDACDGITCETEGEECVLGTCKDVCKDVTCNEHEICIREEGKGICKHKCDRVFCGDKKICIDGECQPYKQTPCSGTTCTDANHVCQDGECSEDSNFCSEYEPYETLTFDHNSSFGFTGDANGLTFRQPPFNCHTGGQDLRYVTFKFTVEPGRYVTVDAEGGFKGAYDKSYLVLTKGCKNDPTSTTCRRVVNGYLDAGDYYLSIATSDPNANTWEFKAKFREFTLETPKCTLTPGTCDNSVNPATFTVCEYGGGKHARKEVFTCPAGCTSGIDTNRGMRFAGCTGNLCEDAIAIDASTKKTYRYEYTPNLYSMTADFSHPSCEMSKYSRYGSPVFYKIDRLMKGDIVEVKNADFKNGDPKDNQEYRVFFQKSCGPSAECFSNYLSKNTPDSMTYTATANYETVYLVLTHFEFGDRAFPVSYDIVIRTP